MALTGDFKVGIRLLWDKSPARATSRLCDTARDRQSRAFRGGKMHRIDGRGRLSGLSAVTARQNPSSRALGLSRNRPRPHFPCIASGRDAPNRRSRAISRSVSCRPGAKPQHVRPRSFEESPTIATFVHRRVPKCAKSAFVSVFRHLKWSVCGKTPAHTNPVCLEITYDRRFRASRVDDMHENGSRKRFREALLITILAFSKSYRV